MSIKKLSRFALVASTLGCLWPTLAAATPIYSAQASATTHGYDPDTSKSLSGDTPVSTGLVLSTLGAVATAQASAAASRGSVGVFTRSTVSVSPGEYGSATATASAMFRVDDLTISEIPGANPTPNPDGTVTVQLSPLHIDGTLTANGQINGIHNGNHFAISSTGISFSMSLGGQSFYGSRSIGGNSNPGEPFLPRYDIKSGIFADQPIPSVNLPRNTPITLQMTLSANGFPMGTSASAAGDPGLFCNPDQTSCTLYPASAFADSISAFGNTVSFAMSGPVFNLPPGYTANSVSAGIVDNRFVPLPGDYNGNGVVDAADFTVWRDHLGESIALTNQDPAGTTPGVVDQEDYEFWKSHFGTGTSGIGTGGGSALPSAEPLSAAAPEPGSLLLLVVGIIGLLLVRPSPVDQCLSRPEGDYVR